MNPRVQLKQFSTAVADTATSIVRERWIDELKAVR